MSYLKSRLPSHSYSCPYIRRKTILSLVISSEWVVSWRVGALRLTPSLDLVMHGMTVSAQPCITGQLYFWGWSLRVDKMQFSSTVLSSEGWSVSSGCWELSGKAMTEALVCARTCS